MSTIELPVLVLNPHMALAQTAEAQRPKVDVPDPVVDLLEADVFADADRGDVDPAAVPPRRELRQARQRGGGERHAVVAANPPRQPILVEQPREDGLGLVASGRRQGLTTQEVTTKAIGHGQWIAVPAIPRAELPLVVGAPHVIGREDLTRRL